MPYNPDNPVDAAIRATAARAGMSPAEWKAIAQIESTLTPQSNRNEGTQYKGLFQIGTRDKPGEPSEWTLHGHGDVYNPMDNANAAAEIAARNNAWFSNYFGRPPTAIETYMMHQQGPGFYKNGTMTNITGNLPAEDQTPENMTHNGFQAYWGAKLARKANGFRDPDDPNEIKYDQGDIYAGQGHLASGGGGGGGGATGASSGTAGGTTDSSTDLASSTDDYAQKMADIANKIAQSQPAMQPMQPMQMPQVQLTPGMLRAKQYAQAMLNLQMQKAGVAQPGLAQPDTGQPDGSATS